MNPIIEAFFNEPTNTVSYLVADPASGAAAVIDPVLDYDPAEGTVDTSSAEAVLARAAERGWTIELVLETHAHADHLSAAPFFKGKTGARIGIGEQIPTVQKVFRPMFEADDIKRDGGDFDLLFEDGERIALGALSIEVMATPGHTAADVSYQIGDALFVGDSLFMPDYGTARTDFPGGDAHLLYRSIQRILALPDATRLFTCHDYKAPGRDEFRWETTVAEQRAGNVHLAGKSEDEFVAMREARDATLATPKLLLPAIQVNIRAGRFPPAEANGVSYLRIPVRVRG
ncbi:MBL fold metallo-hydrolase [Sphingomonas sp.]|uniref:MBL fold metallo-hydrolase n=1 Tax=Sphingomonas sp. TaxID=28214 RepID=UPI00286ABA61|nr:MBL fold metallo-hydrolase [Sphingomonas sp.]